MCIRDRIPRCAHAKALQYILGLLIDLTGTPRHVGFGFILSLIHILRGSFLIISSLFCFFLLFWNNNIQHNRCNRCRNDTGTAEDQLDIIRKLGSCSCCGTKAVSYTHLCDWTAGNTADFQQKVSLAIASASLPDAVIAPTRNYLCLLYT